MMPRKMNTLRFLTRVIAFGLLMAGCVDSEQPLGPRSEAVPDPRLVGLWHFYMEGNPAASSDKSVGRISFDKSGIGRFEDVTPGKEKKDDPIEFFVSRAGTTSFVNLFADKPSPVNPDPAKSYVLLKYRVSADLKSVELWSLRVAALEPAIEAGKLKGRINKDDHNRLHDGVTLQDSAANILKFIAANPDQEVFEKFGVLRKAD